MKTVNLMYFFAGATSTALCLVVGNWLLPNWGNNAKNLKYGRRKLAILFGDSITQNGFDQELSGWVGLLSNYWIRKVNVLNYGYSGYNSRWALTMVDGIITERPGFISVFFGANDAAIPESKQHIPLVEYIQNIDNMIRTMREKLPETAIILITPPPVWEEKLKVFNMNKGEKDPKKLINRTNERAKQYANVCESIAKKYGIGLIDLWSALGGSSSDRAMYLVDGLHLNEKGNLRLFQLVQEVIALKYPAWLSEIMPLDMPHWSANTLV